MCCPENGIGVTITCNSNCTKSCPRVLKVFCCCFGCSGRREESDSESRVQQAVAHAFEEKEKAAKLALSKQSPKTEHHHKIKNKLKKSSRHKSSV